MTAAATQFLRFGLLALLGWSAAVMVVVEGGLGERYSLHPDDPAAVAELPALDLVKAESALKPLEGYAQVGARPLFNPDRRPLPVAAAEPGGGDPAPPPPAELNIVVTSIVLHGDIKVAVLTDKTTNKSQTVRLGQPLQGELAAWTLKELTPRKAVFDGPGGSRPADLRVFDGQGGEAPTAAADPSVPIQPQPETPQQAATSGATASTDEVMTPEQRAELIRQRIEERRRQMREEAARASQEKSQ